MLYMTWLGCGRALQFVALLGGTAAERKEERGDMHNDIQAQAFERPDLTSTTPDANRLYAELRRLTLKVRELEGELQKVDSRLSILMQRTSFLPYDFAPTIIFPVHLHPLDIVDNARGVDFDGSEYNTLKAPISTSGKYKSFFAVIPLHLPGNISIYKIDVRREPAYGVWIRLMQARSGGSLDQRAECFLETGIYSDNPCIERLENDSPLFLEISIPVANMTAGNVRVFGVTIEYRLNDLFFVKEPDLV